MFDRVVTNDSRTLLLSDQTTSRQGQTEVGLRTLRWRWTIRDKGDLAYLCRARSYLLGGVCVWR